MQDMHAKLASRVGCPKTFRDDSLYLGRGNGYRQSVFARASKEAYHCGNRVV